MKYTAQQGYSIRDLIHFGYDHLNTGLSLLAVAPPSTYDSAGFLIHLGIELLLKSYKLQRDSYFKDTHELIDLINDLRILLNKNEIGLVEKIQKFHDLRYPKLPTNCPIGMSDINKIKKFAFDLIDKFPYECQRAFHGNFQMALSGENYLTKGGRTLLLKRYFSIKEAAVFLGVTSQTLRNWDKAGKLKAERSKKNNYRRYLKEDLEVTKSGFLK